MQPSTERVPVLTSTDNMRQVGAYNKRFVFDMNRTEFQHGDYTWDRHTLILLPGIGIVPLFDENDYEPFKTLSILFIQSKRKQQYDFDRKAIMLRIHGMKFFYEIQSLELSGETSLKDARLWERFYRLLENEDKSIVFGLHLKRGGTALTVEMFFDVDDGYEAKLEGKINPLCMELII